MTHLRKRTAQLLEAHHHAGGWGRAIDIFLVVLILINVVVIILETVPSLDALYRREFMVFELVSVIIFSIEYLLRLWSCVEESPKMPGGEKTTRLAWFLSPLGLIDLIAILPFYILLFTPGGDVSLLMLRVFRGLRLLRVFKLTRYSPAIDVLFAVVKKEARGLAVTTFILASILIMASWGIYALERTMQPDIFGSVPAAMWWAVVTLTTVGYGDVVPVTGGGKLFAGLISFIGIGMMALPAGILASGFSSEVHRRMQTYSRAAELVFTDGTLSEQDEQELEALREHLGLSRDQATNANLDARRQKLKSGQCPHCGGELR